jgi:hypothetical protein
VKLEKMTRVTWSALRIVTAGGTELPQGFKQFFTVKLSFFKCITSDIEWRSMTQDHDTFE